LNETILADPVSKGCADNEETMKETRLVALDTGDVALEDLGFERGGALRGSSPKIGAASLCAATLALSTSLSSISTPMVGRLFRAKFYAFTWHCAGRTGTNLWFLRRRFSARSVRQPMRPVM
jgi:hypothetical protein